MGDKVTGTLEVGDNQGEVVINFPCSPDMVKAGSGHLTFSPSQARRLAELLRKRADHIDRLRGMSPN